LYIKASSVLLAFCGKFLFFINALECGGQFHYNFTSAAGFTICSGCENYSRAMVHFTPITEFPAAAHETCASARVAQRSLYPTGTTTQPGQSAR
jgi:hypothetical protein